MIKVCLYGIDCPEKGQRYGKEAWGLAYRLSFGQVVLIESRGKGRYGRTIGNVTLPGGKNLNQELVKAGACWWYKYYAPKDEDLKRLEAEAREAKWSRGPDWGCFSNVAKSPAIPLCMANY